MKDDMQYITDAGDYYLVRVPRQGGGFFTNRTFSKAKYGKAAKREAKAYRDARRAHRDFRVTGRGLEHSRGEALSREQKSVLKRIEKLHAQHSRMALRTLANLSVLEQMDEPFSVQDLRDALAVDSKSPQPLVALKKRQWIRRVGTCNLPGKGAPGALFVVTPSGRKLLERFRPLVLALTGQRPPKRTLRRVLNARASIIEQVDNSSLRLVSTLGGVVWGLSGPNETARVLNTSGAGLHIAYNGARTLGFLTGTTGQMEVTKAGRRFFRLLGQL